MARTVAIGRWWRREGDESTAQQPVTDKGFPRATMPMFHGCTESACALQAARRSASDLTSSSRLTSLSLAMIHPHVWNCDPSKRKTTSTTTCQGSQSQEVAVYYRRRAVDGIRICWGPKHPQCLPTTASVKCPKASKPNKHYLHHSKHKQHNEPDYTSSS